MSSEASNQNTLERIMAERRDKAAKLLAGGHNPYRNDFKPTHSCGAARAKYEALPKPEREGKGITPVDGEVIRLAGRAMARRGMGKTSFIPIRDTSGDLQLFVNVDHADTASFEEVLPLMDVGDIIGAEGTIFWTKRGELSLLVSKLVIITKSLMPLPDKHKGLTDKEKRYRQRYLDLAVNPEVREVFRKRTQIVRGIRRYLDDRDFMEVETPMMHPIIGGAAARPFITHHNALDMRLYMRIAPELYLKRLVVGGFERVYEINRNFRNEGLSRKHNPEFTMLEFYQAYATYEDLMALTEDLIEGLAKEVNGSTRVVWEEQEIELARPWKRLSVKNAVVESAGCSERVFDDPVFAAEAAIDAGAGSDDVIRALIEPLTSDQITEVCREAGKSSLNDLIAAFKDADKRPGIAKSVAERYGSVEVARVRAGHLAFFIFEEKVETDLIQPTFLIDFPLAISPLARKKDADPAYCDRFELFIGGKEICNAFSELNDPVDQRSRFEAQLQAREKGSAETMDYDDDYCRALELGMPPAAGEGIGIDRLTMLLCGQDSIRDVILFPLMRPE
jgi:lysyl-tRNA synthetase class 2